MASPFRLETADGRPVLAVGGSRPQRLEPFAASASDSACLCPVARGSQSLSSLPGSRDRYVQRCSPKHGGQFYGPRILKWP
jgi:hypothetical protein